MKPALNGTWIELNTGNNYSSENFQLKSKKKEKCRLEKAMEAQRGRRGIGLIFLQPRR